MKFSFQDLIPRAREAYAELTLRDMDFQVQEEDAGLTAWFDVRPIEAPARAILLLAAYDSRAARFQETNIDCLTPYSSPIHAGYLDDIGFAMRLHRLRLMVDQIGCPYDFAAMHLFNRLAALGFAHMPSVVELGTGNAAEHLRERWVAATSDRFYVPALKRFKADQYRGEPVQDAYLTFAAGQIKRRPHPEMALASLMLHHGVIPEAWAIERFGERLVTRAKEHHASLHRDV